MKKAAVVVLLLAGVAAVAGEAGIMDGFGNFVADVQAEDELPDNEKAQNESEEVTGEEEDSASQIDTSITIEAGSRIAVVSKATDGEYWKLVHRGMEDAVKDINTAYDFSSDDAVTMTFEGPSDEQDVETQINTLDAVIAENPTVLCMSAGDIESCQAQLEAASENGIPVVVFDSNVNEDELVAAFRGTDNTYVGKLAEYPDITIVSELYTDKVDDMETAMADVLNRYPDLSGVFCTNENVSDLYLGLDKGEKAPVMVGVDATTVQQKAIADGQELGTVSQDPYAIGYQTIIAAAQAMSTDVQKAAEVEKNVLLEPEWIDASNISDETNSNYLYSK